MAEQANYHIFRVEFLSLFLLISGRLVVGNSIETDKQVLLSLRSYLEDQNHFNRGRYTQWNPQDSSPCTWPGISCGGAGIRVTGVDLSDSDVAGEMFGNFSALSELSYLDLSDNTISGAVPDDLGRCKNLRFLNLSHNIIRGELNLTGLNGLEVLDLSTNRILVDIRLAFPAGTCNNLVVANISQNNFTGEIGSTFDACWNLKFLDLSYNNLTGQILFGFDRLHEFSVAQNNLSGVISFTQNCTLRALDLSENSFHGEIPKEISYCKKLEVLNLFDNRLAGPIPKELGGIATLQTLYLGTNNFSREIPDSLSALSNLAFLDLSRNNFGGDIQESFGLFTQVKFLLLHGNSFTGGVYSSGILMLHNLSRLDLSYNNFSGPLPPEMSQMTGLKFLIMAYNRFSGSIPSEYGNFPSIQTLDLSFNRLSGSIPPSLGRLDNLLWLMLANNQLSGGIPPDLGNCSSLLWLNLANNHLTGTIPPQLTSIGSNATPTFLLNRQRDGVTAGSGECLAMKRWIPADYPPFSFVYPLLTRKNCRNLWDKLLKGYGLFAVCVGDVRTYQISGYLQLSGNKLSGTLPPEIGRMHNFSMLHFGVNELYGKLPLEIAQVSLVVLNISSNKFSGEIPVQIGNIRCLQNLDLSYNNFSGPFPINLNNLTDLSKFNISYNPFISGTIPALGQLSTFEKWSYLGDPLLQLPSFIDNTSQTTKTVKPRAKQKFGSFLVFLSLILAFLVCGLATVVVFLVIRRPVDTPGYLLEESKGSQDYVSSSGTSSPWLLGTVKVIRLGKTPFTYSDILTATKNFSDDRIIGRGGFGTVYRGILPDSRKVAVKKLQREGVEGEREFRAEMEVLSGNGFGWPHPNLVKLYGWCLDDTEKLLVYEYMEGGSLEDLVSDRIRLTWRRRIEVAIDVARALVFLHHECVPCIVHRDVKASNVLLDKDGKARVTDFGLARVVDVGDSHVSTMVAGTVGYVAPEYRQTWQATTKGDVYSYGVLAMELATGRRAVDGGEECLVEWARRVTGNRNRNGNGKQGFSRAMVPAAVLVSALAEGAEEMCELLKIGIKCTAETPQARPHMKDVLNMLIVLNDAQQ